MGMLIKIKIFIEKVLKIINVIDLLLLLRIEEYLLNIVKVNNYVYILMFLYS